MEEPSRAHAQYWIGRRLRGIVAGAIPILVTLAAIELVLRAFPGAMPIDVGTAIYSVYGNNPGDIYFSDRPTHAIFMRPNYRAHAYWNGYVWEHRTDELGFRNPPGLRDRSIVWLGDSMIYGHGVEEDDTAVSRLRHDYGLGAYNAARQGDCLYQEYLVARLLLSALAPRTLILTVFINDFDLEPYRTPEEVSAAPELDLDVAALAARLAHPPTDWRPHKQVHRLKLWRLAGWVGNRIRQKYLVPQPPPETDPQMPSYVLPILDDARWKPVAHYYERIINDLATRARASGAELLLLNLDTGNQVAGLLPAEDRVRALIESIGHEHSLVVLDTRSLFEGCETCFLPNDGHLSPEGHRLLAEFVARSLRARRVGLSR